MDQAGTLRKVSQNAGKKGGVNKVSKSPLGIAIASGKGGVGKTNIVANIAVALAKRKKRVLIFDADVGLGNVHILLGLVPKYNLQHVLDGRRNIKDVIVDGPGGIKILPAASGGKKYDKLAREEKIILRGELETLNDQFDFILFDIAAGTSSNVIYFCTVSQEIIVVSTSEPTSFADAYALMKILSRDFSRRSFRLVVNMVKNEKEAIGIFDKLTKVSDKFNLNISIDYLGYLGKDNTVPDAVKKQGLFLDMYPDSKVSSNITTIAKNIISMDTSDYLNWDKVF